MIFAINHRHHAWTWAPVITRRWFEILGYYSRFVYSDTWIQHVGHKIKRYIQVPNPIKLVLNANQGPLYCVPKPIRKQAIRGIRRNTGSAAHQLLTEINNYKGD